MYDTIGSKLRIRSGFFCSLRSVFTLAPGKSAGGKNGRSGPGPVSSGLRRLQSYEASFDVGLRARIAFIEDTAAAAAAAAAAARREAMA